MVTTYVLDTSLPYASVAEERDGSDALTARYVYGDDLARMDRSDTSYYLYDGLGSTRQLTDGSGAVADTYRYDAFGNLVAQTGTTPNPFLFDGQQMDAGTGLYYLRARYMNTVDGRFLSQDPYQGDREDPETLHRYLYASNDPVGRVDPGGRLDGIAGTLVGIGATLAFYGTFARGIIIGARPNDGFAQVPASLNDPALSTTDQFIIVQTNKTASAYFENLRRFDGFSYPKPSGAVSGRGQDVSWSFAGGLEAIGQYDFSVSCILYEPNNYSFCVETNDGHPLTGYRYWRVTVLSQNEYKISTVSVEYPTFWNDSLKLALGGAYVMQNGWRDMLHQIVQDTDPNAVILSDQTRATVLDYPDPGAVSLISHGPGSPTGYPEAP